MIVFWSLTLLCFSCKKEAKTCDCPTNGNICTDLPLPGSGGYGYSFTYDTGYITYPYFNPNNANEIIFYKPHSSTGPQLIKFNLQTGQQQVIFSQSLIDAPKWGRNGWILLSLGQIYKMKDNGDSLTQLTFGNSNNYHPEWNYVGDKFITEYVGSSYNYSIYDVSGNLLDTLPDVFDEIDSWQNQNNLLLVKMNNGLGVFNPETDSLCAFIAPSTGETFYGQCNWYPDGVNIINEISCGVHKLNYESGGNICIQSTCSNDGYYFPTISSASQKIIFSISHSQSIGNSSLYISSKLVLMNFDGTGQQVINAN
jgi:hypothetical protein